MPKPLFRKKEETKTNNLFSIDFEQKESNDYCSYIKKTTF